MYRIDEGLSIISTEVTNHLDLIIACEYCLDERDDFMRGEGVVG